MSNEPNQKLQIHLPFCQQILDKVKNTQYESKWQSLVDIILRPDGYSTEQINSISSTLTTIKLEFTPEKNQKTSAEDSSNPVPAESVQEIPKIPKFRIKFSDVHSTCLLKKKKKKKTKVESKSKTAKFKKRWPQDRSDLIQAGSSSKTTGEKSLTETSRKPMITTMSLKVTNLVSHMSYQIVSGSPVFRCHLCKILSTKSKDEFQKHLNREHQLYRWFGGCKLCSCSTNSQGTLSDELNHMIDQHIQKDPMFLATERVDKIPMISIPNSALTTTDGTRSSTLVTNLQTKHCILNTGHLHVKSMSACEEMNSFECLSALFKCMGSTCSFFTSDASIFANHLTLHGTFQKSDSQNFLSCSYCRFSDKNQNNLIEHINNVHGCEQYQCGYCFYRSFSVQIEIHISAHHSNLPRKFIICSVAKSKLLFEPATAWEKCIKNVPAMSCMLCKEKFYNFEEYSKHLNSHSKIPTSKCLKCKKPILPETIIVHLTVCHGINRTQCAFCRYGSKELSATFRLHIADCHPEQPPLYFQRSNEVLKDNRSLVKTDDHLKISLMMICFEVKCSDSEIHKAAGASETSNEVNMSRLSQNFELIFK